MNQYKQLPSPPEQLSAGTILKRLLDGSGFRYSIAVDTLDKTLHDFRPVDSSMSIYEVNQHIFHLFRLTAKSLSLNPPIVHGDSFEIYRDNVFILITAISECLGEISDDDLARVNVHLKRLDKDFSFWYLINGFLADALTHIGQIISWRRIAGSPVKRISPFTGDLY